MGKQPAKLNTFESAGVFNIVSFTVGAELTNAINVAMVLKNANGRTLDEVAVFRAYLCDAATGQGGVTATVPDSGVAVGTKGDILASLVTNKMWELSCDVDGGIDLTITHSGVHSYYLLVIDPMGNVHASPVIAFT